MAPPSLLIGFGKGQAARQPDEDVVVQGAALLQLGDPHVVKTEAAPNQPGANALEKGRDVLGLEPIDVAIGEREHGRLELATAEVEVKEPSRDVHGAAHAPETSFLGIDLYRVGVWRVTCLKDDKPRDAAGSRRACRRIRPQRRPG
jgi:hypothetical protein